MSYCDRCAQLITERSKLRAEVEKLRAALDDVPKAIRIAAKFSPYAKNRTEAFLRGLFDGYEAAAQVADHMARAALEEKPTDAAS